MNTTTDNPASQRPKPPPLEPRCPPCSICAEDTSYEDEQFICHPCGAAWGEDDYHYQAGEWTDEGDQCPWALAYWRDSVRYPDLRDTVYRCLLTEGHEGEHRDPEYFGGWDDKTENAYAVEQAGAS